MAVIRETVIQKFIGLSTDTKPTAANVGSQFYEYDTKNTYICYDGTNWVLYDSLLKIDGVAKTTIDLKQAAGNYDLFTCSGQDVIVQQFVLKLPNEDVSDDAAITGISVQTDDATPKVFISATEGDVTNLTPEVQLSCNRPILVSVGRKIQLTIYGGAADNNTVCDVYAVYLSPVSGGLLS